MVNDYITREDLTKELCSITHLTDPEHVEFISNLVDYIKDNFIITPKH